MLCGVPVVEDTGEGGKGSAMVVFKSVLVIKIYIFGDHTFLASLLCLGGGDVPEAWPVCRGGALCGGGG